MIPLTCGSLRFIFWADNGVDFLINLVTFGSGDLTRCCSVGIQSRYLKFCFFNFSLNVDIKFSYEVTLIEMEGSGENVKIGTLDDSHYHA